MDVVGGEGRLLAPLVDGPTVASIREVPRGARGEIQGQDAMLPGPMRNLTTALGVLLALAGAVWMAQGLNLPFAPGSFMTGDRAWIVLGALAVLGGVGLVTLARRR